MPRQRSAFAVASRPMRRGVSLLSAHVRCATSLVQCANPRVEAVATAHRHVIAPLSIGSARHFTSFLPTASRRRPQKKSVHPPPPPLPDAKIVRVDHDCALEYFDLPPASADPSEATTLVLLHGAPGTYKDFRHLVPHLQQQMPGARIVGLNLPGFGGSTVDETRYFELLDAQRTAQLSLRALHHLIDGNARVVLVGHSFGGHAALNVAALNSTASPADKPLAIAGLVLLASAGTRPHRALRPRLSALVVEAMQSSPLAVRQALARVVKTFYTTILRFPSDFPTSHFVAGVLRASTTDFRVVHDHVALLRAARVRSLSAWSRDDEFMEDAIPTALAAALGSDARLVFRGAGHNLQKTRADVLAREIAAWVACDAPTEAATAEMRP